MSALKVMFIEPAMSICPRTAADVGGDLGAGAVGADQVLGPDGVVGAGQPVQHPHAHAVGVLGVREVLGGELGLGAAHGRVLDQDRLEVGLRDVDSSGTARPVRSRPRGPGCVPQVRIRPISSPAIEVQNTVSPIISCGVASASTCSSMPRSRKISMVRWLVMCARGRVRRPAVLGDHDVRYAQAGQEQCGRAAGAGADDQDVGFGAPGGKFGLGKSVVEVGMDRFVADVRRFLQLTGLNMAEMRSSPVSARPRARRRPRA